MKFSPDTLLYLEGKSFSNGLQVKFDPKKEENISRLDLLEKLAKGKKVIHVGFTDHIPLIEKKIKANQWLHKRLESAAEQCVGIDIDAEAVDFVKNKLNIGNVHTLDIVNDPVPDYLNKAWDLMIIGEVLEHIDDPVSFLRAIRNKYGKHIKQLVITVPNAFDNINILFAFRSVEFINTDHRYWFTPFTLGKVGMRAGYTIEQFHLCQTFMPDRWWQKWMVKRFPMFRETVVMIFNFQ